MRALRTMAIGFGVFVVGSWCPPVWAGAKPDAEELVIVGEEIFQRRWVANDPRSRTGDGLGPVYNAASCLACHNQKGPGGGGGMESNVEILTPIVSTGNARPSACITNITSTALPSRPPCALGNGKASSPSSAYRAQTAVL